MSLHLHLVEEFQEPNLYCALLQRMTDFESWVSRCLVSRLVTVSRQSHADSGGLREMGGNLGLSCGPGEEPCGNIGTQT